MLFCLHPTLSIAVLWIVCPFERNELTPIHLMFPETCLFKVAPGFCDNHRKFNYSSVEPIRAQLDQYWPDYEIRWSFIHFFIHSFNSLWTHEWENHGTCAAQLHLFIHISIFLFIQPSIINSFIYSSFHLFIIPFIHSFIKNWAGQPMDPRMGKTRNLSGSSAIHPFIQPSVHQSIYLSFHPSI